MLFKISFIFCILSFCLSGTFCNIWWYSVAILHISFVSVIIFLFLFCSTLIIAGSLLFFFKLKKYLVFFCFSFIYLTFAIIWAVSNLFFPFLFSSFISFVISSCLPLFVFSSYFILLYILFFFFVSILFLLFDSFYFYFVLIYISIFDLFWLSVLFILFCVSSSSFFILFLKGCYFIVLLSSFYNSFSISDRSILCIVVNII